MASTVNQLLIALGILGAFTATLVLAADLGRLPHETLPRFAFCLTLFAASAALLASAFSIFCIDKTGITEEGQVTAIIPTVLASCGLALTLRWTPDHIVVASTWFALHLPGAFVGLQTPISTLQQTLRRQQAIVDRGIAIQWELKQLTNRVTLLEQLLRAGGPDPSAQKKLATTGHTLQKYYDDTKQQLEEFLAQAKDDQQRNMATQLLTKLQQMHVADL